MKYFLFALLCMLPTQATPCEHYGDIRLQGSNELRGNVEICMNRTWKRLRVCKATWSVNDAVVVCRQLGNSPQGASPKGNEPEEEGDCFNMMCSGTETKLIDCNHKVNSKKYKPAYVKCTAGAKPNVTSLQTSATSATIKWSPPKEKITQYNITCTTTDSQYQHKVHTVVANTTMELQLTELLPSTMYECCVYAIMPTYSTRTCSTAATNAARWRWSIVEGVLGILLAIAVFLLGVLCTFIGYHFVVQHGSRKKAKRNSRNIENPAYDTQPTATATNTAGEQLTTPLTTPSKYSMLGPTYETVDRARNTNDKPHYEQQENSVKDLHVYSRLQH